MRIGGIEKTTLIDYPGEIATIIFTQGCNFRCQFCYNPMLVWPESEDSELKYSRDHSKINEDDLFDFLKKRKGKIDAVVVTGGEPTIHPDLPEFLRKIKALGFKIKLDTNGTNPEMLASIVGVPLAGTLNRDMNIETKRAGASPAPTLIDYLAMDIKAPLEKYEQITQVKVNPDNIKKSIKMIMESGLPYEFRTTIPPELLNKEDIRKMGELIKEIADSSSAASAQEGKWYLQFFKSDTDLVNQKLRNRQAYTGKEMAELVEIAGQYVKFSEARG